MLCAWFHRNGEKIAREFSIHIKTRFALKVMSAAALSRMAWRRQEGGLFWSMWRGWAGPGAEGSLDSRGGHRDKGEC